MTLTTVNLTAPGTWGALRLGRYGGLAVDALPAPESAVLQALDGLDGLERELDEQRVALLDALFAEVPTVEDSRLRRRVLSAKRRVFASAQSGLSDDPRLDGRLAGLCRSWDRAVGERDALLDELSAALARQERDLAEALRRTLADEDFRAALAVAAPDFVRALQDGHVSTSSAKFLRSIYLYVARTSRKTSPFSGLTTVAELGRPARGRGVALVAYHLAIALLQAGVLEQSGDDLRIAPSPVKAQVDAHADLALIPRHVFRDGIVFREETVVDAEHVRGWADRVDGSGPITPRDVADSVGGRDPETRVRRLLDTGVVRPVIPWARTQDPYDVLSELFVCGVAAVEPTEIAVLRQLSERFVEASTDARLSLLDRVRTIGTQVFDEGELGERPGGLVYEDREATVAEGDPLALPAVAQDLDALAELVEPEVFRSHGYDLMVSRFVALYGRGGVCRDPLSFFMRLAIDNDGDPEAMTALRRDLMIGAEEKLERRTGVGPTAVARHLGAYLQFAAPSIQALADGNGRTVVNSFGSGNGALQARYHRLFGRDYRARLRRHIHSLWTPETVLELEVWASCNTGQAACAGVLPELRLPGEPQGLLGVGLDELRLCHDPATEAVFLAGAEPVGLAYLGLTPQHLLPSYFRWLALLSDPWVRFPMHSDYAKRQYGHRNRPRGRVAAIPREQHGRLVTGRATWWVPVQREAMFPAADVAIVRWWHAFAREHGLPTEVFAHQVGSTGGSTNDLRKPLYVDLSAPLSLRCLERWLAPGTTEVVLVEALPDRTGHVSRTAQDRPCVSEYVACISWPEGDDT